MITLHRHPAIDLAQGLTPWCLSDRARLESAPAFRVDGIGTHGRRGPSGDGYRFDPTWHPVASFTARGSA
ncbi:MAG: hypothetical protein QM674_12165 [Burkholderiaceae bacterium]